MCVYGGSGVANQITELKRGTEIVVCTPGRMIDLLVTSGGKITNMRRVTYLVGGCNFFCVQGLWLVATPSLRTWQASCGVSSFSSSSMLRARAVALI